MGIFRFIRTWQINGNLGGARVTASKNLISNPKTMVAATKTSCPNGSFIILKCAVYEICTT